MPRPSGAGISRVVSERTSSGGPIRETKVTATMTRRERCHHDGDFYLGRRSFTGTHSPAIIVAVPARNEAERIERCLAALANQRDLNGTPFPDGRVGVLVLLNNCTDQSFEARRLHRRQRDRGAVLSGFPRAASQQVAQH